MAPLAQINIRTTTENLADFHRFCARQGLTAYGMLRLVVDSWAAAERLIRALEEKRMGQAEALADLGALVEKVRVVTKANGVFTEAVARAAKHYGIELSVAAGGGETPSS
ncbi:MAG: hypothetical protein Q8P22_06150 [Chloroflexota bacterium]|nr:hypothetical protein [Chloroflexota bacterium]